MNHKIGLALGSGAARGLAHIGVLQALTEASVPVDIIAGCSMGAMVGACFAKNGDLAAAQALGQKMHWKQLARLLDPGLNILKLGLVQGKRLTDHLYSLIGDIHFENLKIPMAIIATDINTGEEIVIRHGSVIEAVRASISIPGIFVPVKNEGRYLVDGGLTNPVPADILKKMGADFVIAVNVLTEPKKRKTACILEGGIQQVPNMLNTLLQSIYIMEYEVMKPRVIIADVIINPDVSCIEAFEFHKKEEAITVGYNATIAALPEIRELLTA